MLQTLASATASTLASLSAADDDGEGEGELTSDGIRRLYLLYTSSFISALDILDREQVIQTVEEEEEEEVGESRGGRQGPRRTLYAVLGSSERPYEVLPQAGYCTCPAFQMNVIVTRQTAMCKHLLAVRLALVLHRGMTRRRMSMAAYLDMRNEAM